MTHSLVKASINTDVAERMYIEWDKALSANDPELLLAFYAEDATIESPLVPHLTGKQDGICRGHAEMRPFFKLVAERKPKLREYYRRGYFTDGRTLMFEYPRDAPEGEQMDFVEVMELNGDGLIQHHKVYWGWRGVKVMQDSQYHH
jgi:hypothetical protein